MANIVNIMYGVRKWRAWPFLLVLIVWVCGAVVALPHLWVTPAQHGAISYSDKPMPNFRHMGTFDYVQYSNGPNCPGLSLHFDHLSCENAQMAMLTTGACKQIKITNLKIQTAQFTPSNVAKAALQKNTSQDADMLNEVKEAIKNMYDPAEGMFFLDASNAAGITIKGLEYSASLDDRERLYVKSPNAKVDAFGQKVILSGHALVRIDGKKIEGTCMHWDPSHRKFEVQGRYFVRDDHGFNTGLNGTFEYQKTIQKLAFNIGR